ncbi:MAG: hypothetical protein AAF799_11285 [Myxococcota bacterium]
MGSRLSFSDLTRSSRRRVGLAFALGAALSLAATTAEAAPSKPKNAKARAHFDRAVEFYTAKDFDGAIREAEAGYELEPNEGLLFLWAQAERQNGNCVEAVPLFNSFIEMTTNEDMKQNALQAKGICAEELAASARATDDGTGEDIGPAPGDDDLDIQPVTPEPTPRDDNPWYRDPLGGALVGVGGTSVLVGAALLISAGVLSPDRAPDYGTFVDRLELQPKLLLGGGILTGVGLAVGAAGGVRWWMLSRKSSSDSQARVFVVPYAGRTGSGVGVTGRF